MYTDGNLVLIRPYSMSFKIFKKQYRISKKYYSNFPKLLDVFELYT